MVINEVSSISWYIVGCMQYLLICLYCHVIMQRDLRQQNHGCAEEAKRRFQEVRTAYELLQPSRAVISRGLAAAGGA